MRDRWRSLDLRRSWQRTDALIAIPLAFIVAITVADILSPPTIHLGPLLVVAPAITASFADAAVTGIIGAAAVGAQVVIGALHGGVFTANHQVQILALIVISGILVLFRYIRDRHEQELSQVRQVAEAAQQVLLRPLPRQTGSLRIASVYLAAEAEAQIGGDLYAAVRTSHGTRLIVGDVRGKGLPSIGDAALLLGAFRAAAHRQAALPDLVRYLEGAVTWAPAEPAEEDPEAEESFITAVALDIDDDDPVIRVINCGHPPPLLVRNGRVIALEARKPSLPLGLSDLATTEYDVEMFEFEPGDLLLLYTDGVIEARNAGGSYYPLTERLAAWNGSPGPEALLRHLHDDLLEHTGGVLDDDAAMIAIERIHPSDVR